MDKKMNRRGLLRGDFPGSGRDVGGCGNRLRAAGNCGRPRGDAVRRGPDHAADRGQQRTLPGTARLLHRASAAITLRMRAKWVPIHAANGRSSSSRNRPMRCNMSLPAALPIMPIPP